MCASWTYSFASRAEQPETLQQSKSGAWGNNASSVSDRTTIV
jgi:hypothetical protein